MAKEFDNYNEFKPESVITGSIRRNKAFPIDVNELFLSLSDAITYATSYPTKAYAGQIIGVKTGVVEREETDPESGDPVTVSYGVYDAYIIQGDGTLKPFGGSGDVFYHPDSSLLEQGTVAIGGFPAGTTGEELSGKSFSEMFDTLLFPTYCPVFISPSATITLSSTSLVEIYGTFPTPTYSYSRAYTQTSESGANRVYGGNMTSETKTPPSTSSSTPGTKTWSYSVTFAKGTDGVKNSKGGVMTENKTATDYTTLITNGTENSNLEADGNKYVIKQLTKTTTNSIEVVYPYYLPNKTDGTPTKQTLTSNTYMTNYAYNSKNTGVLMYVEMPSTATNVKILMKNVSGVYENQPLKAATDVTKTINGNNISYKRYQVDFSDLNGDAEYRVEFTKPTT